VINTDRRAMLTHRVGNVGRATHELHIMASSSIFSRVLRLDTPHDLKRALQW
jgi:hypothetical protein